MQSGKMCFISWSEFKEEFMLAFFPENKATIVLMWLQSDYYFQGKTEHRGIHKQVQGPVTTRLVVVGLRICCCEID
jgi:hypothetical protein